MRVRLLGEKLLEGFLYRDDNSDDVEVLVAVTHTDGKVKLEVSTDHLDELELAPVDALRIALALKQHAELAEQQRKGTAATT